MTYKVGDMNDKIVATPKLGILKGILIILLGLMWLNNYSYGAISLSQEHSDRSWLVSAWPGWVILGLCLWRGILAILQRNKKRVTTLNIGFWAVLFVLTLAYVIYILH
jgi:hypothetical protein